MNESEYDIEVVPPTVQELIKQALPINKMIGLLAEGLVAEKAIHSRAEGIIYHPDWQARIKYLELRLKLGGELDGDVSTGEINKTVNLIINGKKIYTAKEGL